MEGREEVTAFNGSTRSSSRCCNQDWRQDHYYHRLRYILMCKCKRDVLASYFYDNSGSALWIYLQMSGIVEATLDLPLTDFLHHTGIVFAMKRKIIWLAAASTACGSPHVFSVNDDLFAFPQVSFKQLLMRIHTANRSHYSTRSSSPTPTS